VQYTNLWGKAHVTLFMFCVRFQEWWDPASLYWGYFSIVYLTFEGRLAMQSFIPNDTTVQLIDTDLILSERADRLSLLHICLPNCDILSLTQEREAEAAGLHYHSVRDPTSIVNSKRIDYDARLGIQCGMKYHLQMVYRKGCESVPSHRQMCLKLRYNHFPFPPGM